MDNRTNIGDLSPRHNTVPYEHISNEPTRHGTSPHITASNYLPNETGNRPGKKLFERNIQQLPESPYIDSSPEELEGLLRREKEFLEKVNEKNEIFEALKEIRPLLSDTDNLKNSLKDLKENSGFSITYQYKGKNSEEVSVIPPSDKLSEEEQIHLLKKLVTQMTKMDQKFEDGQLAELSKKIQSDIQKTTEELIKLNPDSTEFDHQPQKASVITLSTYLPEYPTRFNTPFNPSENEAHATKDDQGGFFLYSTEQNGRKPTEPLSEGLTPPPTTTEVVERTTPKLHKPPQRPVLRPQVHKPHNDDETPVKSVIPTERVPQIETEEPYSKLWCSEDADKILERNKIDFLSTANKFEREGSNIAVPKTVSFTEKNNCDRSISFICQLESPNTGAQHSNELSNEFSDNLQKVLQEQKNKLIENDTEDPSAESGLELSSGGIADALYSAFRESAISRKENDNVNFCVFLVVDSRNYLIARNFGVTFIPQYYPDQIRTVYLDNSDPEVQTVLKDREPYKDPELLPAIAELPPENDESDPEKHTHLYCLPEGKFFSGLRNKKPLIQIVKTIKPDENNNPDPIIDAFEEIIGYLCASENTADLPTIVYNFATVNRANTEEALEKQEQPVAAYIKTAPTEDFSNESNASEQPVSFTGESDDLSEPADTSDIQGIQDLFQPDFKDNDDMRKKLSKTISELNNAYRLSRQSHTESNVSGLSKTRNIPPVKESASVSQRTSNSFADFSSLPLQLPTQKSGLVQGGAADNIDNLESHTSEAELIQADNSKKAKPVEVPTPPPVDINKGTDREDANKYPTMR